MVPRPYTLPAVANAAMEQILDEAGAPYKTARELKVIQDARAALKARLRLP